MKRIKIDTKHLGDLWRLPCITKAYKADGKTYLVFEQGAQRIRLTDEVTEELARSIAAEYYYLKTSELMLFLQWFKMGHYGRFYGAVDPLVITTALQDFILDRRMVYAQRVQEEERRKREAWANDDNMTYEEYQKRKKEEKNE